MQYFYAYHGPNNEKNFTPEGGYGISTLSKHARVRVGDRVFIIQKLAGKTSKFYLCGEYEVIDHTVNHDSAYPYRFSLEDISCLDDFIELDPGQMCEKLPYKEGDKRLNNFQRHFCRQGASFAAPLDMKVVNVLRSLTGSFAENDELTSRREDGLRLVKIRKDQDRFRRAVLENWQGKCAITGSSLAVEACHIVSHASKGEPVVENGIALASDLHHLFDNNDLSFINNKVVLSERAQREKRYHDLHNSDLRRPHIPVNFIVK